MPPADLTPFDSPTSGKTTINGDPRLEVGHSRELFYLLVFEGDASTVFELPQSGTVVVGRQEGCELRLQDKQVSRAHCRITTDEGRATLIDLESQNGTAVNGERIIGSRLLVSGDVISISATSLVFHARGRSEERRQICDFEVFCRRAAVDVERAERLLHSLTLATIVLGVEQPDWPRIREVLLEETRRIDLLGRATGDQLMIVMPGLDQNGAREAIKRVIFSLVKNDPRLKPRAGFAVSPADGSDLDTLIANSRAACEAATAGEVSSAHAAHRMLSIGDRKVVVIEPAMKRLYALIERLARAELPVIVHGETGTGKELAAQALHAWSKRSSGPFVALNCAAMPEALAESELFGHVKGAFSSASDHKAGLLETASGGTVFFDEVGELPLPIQAKLLRALETKRIVRLGDVQDRAVDIRVIAATNRDLREEVKAGNFRQDLFFRLSGGALWIPPLRDRPQELPVLAEAFLKDACERAGREPMHISDEALRRLRAHSWPGNVRELKNVVDYVVAAYPDAMLEARHLVDRMGGQTADLPSLVVHEEPKPAPPAATERKFRPIEEELRELEKDRMREALIAAEGSQKKAAELISMPLRTFVTKLKLYDLKSQVRLVSSIDNPRGK